MGFVALFFLLFWSGRVFFLFRCFCQHRFPFFFPGLLFLFGLFAVCSAHLAHIVHRFQGERFFGKVLFDLLLDERINDGEERHADEHTDESEDTRHERDGDDDPNGRKTRGGAMDTGRDDIAVDLLQNEDHHDEVYGVDGVCDEQDDGAWDRTDERSEIRNDVGNADDDADKRCIRQAQDRHQNEANDTDEEGVDDSACEIFAEGVVCQGYDAENIFVGRFLKDGANEFLGLRGDAFLCHQEVDGKYDSEYDIECTQRNGLQHRGDDGQILLQKVVGIVDKFVDGREQGFDGCRKCAAACRNGVGKVLDRLKIRREFITKVFDAICQLRQNHPDKERKQYEEREKRHDDGNDSSCRSGKSLFGFSVFEDLFLEYLHKRI